MDEPQFIFVIGCQRSGTTLVGQVLGAHRACLFIDETDGLYPWLEPQLERGWQPRDERWPELIKTADQKYRPAFRRLDQDGRLHPQITHVVLQAPNITYYLPELEERLPRAAYIFVTRDARDIVVSMNKLSSIPMVENQTRRIKSRPELAARFSNETARLGDASVPLHRKRAIVARVKMSLLDDFLGSSLHTLWIRYEDLVCDPDRTGRTLLDHVGLPDDEQVSNHGSVFVGLGSGLTARTRPIDTAGVASFRDRLDPLVRE